MDYYSELVNGGFSLDSLAYAKQDADRKGIDFTEYLSILYSQMKEGKTSKEIMSENQFPTFYDEDRNGDLTQGKYTYDNLVECYRDFTTLELVEAVQYIYTENYTAVDRAKAEALILSRASDLRKTTAINSVIKEVRATYKKTNQEIGEFPIPSDLLKLDKDGNPKSTIENFRVIMENDPFYNGGEPLQQCVRFNVVSNRAEIHTPHGKRNWEEVDYSASMEHIETVYSLYDKQKHDSALFSFWKSREYNPITVYLDTLKGKWDGEERCSQFLTVWGKASNDEYTKAISRLIFDGAVARAYTPGIKFDDVPVLTGKQGSGKSTLCTFLAVNDLYHGSISVYYSNEQKNFEKLEGKWIVELEELVAKKDVEFQGRLKAFISSKIDTYRKPYGRGVSDLPRRCTFIGTTNHEDFLSDLTGNRRFYPVAVRCKGRYLFQHEQEIRDYIDQCYAEAVDHYYNKSLMLVLPEPLLIEAESRQSEAMQPNFVFDAVMEFLDEKKVGELFTIHDIWGGKMNLSARDVLDNHLINDIATILHNCDCVVKTKNRIRVQGTDNKRTLYEKINPNLPPID